MVCSDVLPHTSVRCNLGSHSSSLLPLFLYIKFHSNLIILIAAFLNSKQTAPRNAAFRGTQWADFSFFFGTDNWHLQLAWGNPNSQCLEEDNEVCTVLSH